MTSKPVTLAKLSPPKLFGVLPRERLFARLDLLSERPAIWITGPPGAGKTSLAASYLRSREQAGTWFQMDPGDTDPAAFFHSLALAAPSQRPGLHGPLQPLTPEFLVDLPGFARRFFRALYERLPSRAVMVFELDPLAEPLYRRLMALQAQQGHQAEASRPINGAGTCSRSCWLARLLLKPSAFTGACWGWTND